MGEELKPSELPWGWLTPGSNEQLWGQAGTYKSVPYEALPPLQRVGTGLAWLRAAAEVPAPLTVMDADDAPSLADLGTRLDQLTAEARELELVVPPDLRVFMTDPGIHGRVPTVTACYLDLPVRLVPLPDDRPGKLLRFMNDQQCCVLWYLHLIPGGQHRVVCVMPEFDDDGTARPSTTLSCCAISWFAHRASTSSFTASGWRTPSGSRTGRVEPCPLRSGRTWTVRGGPELHDALVGRGESDGMAEARTRKIIVDTQNCVWHYDGSECRQDFINAALNGRCCAW
jgi:hypothetical protein